MVWNEWNSFIFERLLWTCFEVIFNILYWGPQSWSQYSGGVSQVQSRGGESLPSICCPYFLKWNPGCDELTGLQTLLSWDHIFINPMSLSLRIPWIHLFLSLYWYWRFPHSRCLYLAFLSVMMFTLDCSWSLSSTFWMTSLLSLVPWCHL